MTILGLVLVGVLAWILWPTFGKHTHIVVIPMWAGDKLKVPPIAYCREDAEALRTVPHRTYQIWRILEESGKISGLGGRLERLLEREDDILIVYVSAHGVSNDGTAYLLRSDFLRQGPTRLEKGSGTVAPAAHGELRTTVSDPFLNSGCQPVPELMEQIAGCQASLKLLVLDTGRIAADPRLGMVANEFPQLVEKEIRRIKDPSLWVLASNSVFQTSGVANSQGRSVFGKAVADGLSGYADLAETEGDGSLKVSLAELYRFVIRRMDDWFDTDLGAEQTALLMHAEQGLVPLDNVPADLFLVTLERNWQESLKKDESSGNQQIDNTGGLKDAAGRVKNRSRQVASASAGRRAATRPGRSAVSRAATLASDATTASSSDAPATGDDAGAKSTSDSPEDKNEAAVKADRDAVKADGDAAESATTEEPPVLDEPAETPADPPPADGPTVPDEPGAEGSPDAHPLDLRGSLHAAWQIRDRLQDREVAGGFSPVDYAPHLWRELSALLLDFELRSHGGSAFDSKELARELASLLTDLRRFEGLMVRQAAPPAVLADESSVANRLTAAWGRFLAERSAKADFSESKSELDKARRAVRYHADLAFLAPYYVRWHQQTSLSTTDEVPVFQDISKMLDHLADFGRLIESLEGRPLDALAEQDLVRGRVRLEEIRTRIDRRLRQDGDAALASIDHPINERRIEDLLSTPLLSAERRKRMLDELTRPGREPPRRGEADRRDRPPSLSVPQSKLERLLDRLQLEQKLVSLAEPDVAKEIEQRLASLRRLVRAGAESEGRFWHECRAIGRGLRSFYEGLPGDIEDRLARGTGSDDRAVRQAVKLLRLVDGRDSRSLGDIEPFQRLRILPPALPEELAIVGDDELNLDLTTWQPLDLTVEATGTQLEGISATLNFDPDLIQLRQSGQDRPIDPRKSYPVQLGSDGKGLLRYEVIAKTEQVAVARLTLRVKSDRRSAEHTVRCTLPKPNEIDLVALRIGASQARTSEGNRLRLRPFPNRTTAFRLSLVNRSGKPKNVKADLIAVPVQLRARWAPGQLFGPDGRLHPGVRRSLFDATDSLLPGVKVLSTTTKPVALPADGSPVEIDFPPPGSGTKAAGPGEAAAKNAADAKNAAETKPLPPAVTHGLVCIITNAEDNKDRWIKWIELAPLAPKEYLNAQIGYDLSKERITIQLAPKDVDGDGQPDPDEVLPLGLAEKPIEVVWDAAGQVPAAVEKNDRDALDGSKPAAKLYAVVEPDGKDRIVRLTVDGYPRAFVYRVTCAETRPGTDLKPSLEQIRIKSLSVADYPKVFHFPMKGRPPAEPTAEADKETKKETVYLGPDQPAAFPAPCRAIIVEYRVDAPADAFQLPDREDVIELALQVESASRHRLYTDRQMVARLAKTRLRGLVMIQTEVGDYTVKLPPGGLQNKRFALCARLVLAGSEAQSHLVGVVLDGLPPRVDAFYTRPDHTGPIPPGKTVAAYLQLTDLAGIEKVEFGFDTDQSGDLEKKEIVVVKDLGKPPAGNIWSATLDTKDQPPKCQLMARATDKVGLSTRAKPLLVTIPSPQPGEGGGLEKGTIRGVVMFGSQPVDRAKVTIKDSGIPPKKTKDDGKFIFLDVPAGQYTLEAKGNVDNRSYSGKLEPVEPSPPKSPKDVVIPLE